MMTNSLPWAATLVQPERLVPFAIIRAAIPRKKLRFSNRKSGIRIQPKSQRISFLQISNRKYSAIFSSVFRSLPAGSDVLLQEANQVGEAEDLAFSFEQSGVGDFGLA